jgi:hypothetical protein
MRLPKAASKSFSDFSARFFIMVYNLKYRI